MKKNNFNLGGEQSGHIILGKFATTGDGLLVALEVLFAIRKGKKASTYFDKFKKTPQILENIVVKNKDIINHLNIKKSIKLTGAPILDISSGGENELGVKCPKKIRDVIDYINQNEYLQ